LGRESSNLGKGKKRGEVGHGYAGSVEDEHWKKKKQRSCEGNQSGLDGEELAKVRKIGKGGVQAPGKRKN